MNSDHIQSWLKLAVCAAGLSAVSMTGCQVSVGGQTLPSAYYLRDDVQYHQAGPEFILSKEAAQLQAFQAEQELQSP